MSASETLDRLENALTKLGEARVVFSEINDLLDQAKGKVSEAMGEREIPKFTARVESILRLKDIYLNNLIKVSNAEDRINFFKDDLLNNDIQE